ncbi:phage baseplate assembly protein V [Sneathiella sp.]|jgi:cytoskeletal protein CcmA (bactofilin family)|uniref:phage baseplate assembly protein V n=1 Tax=Sneathiella sp. TaxID=1964365 RepID=UPI0039E60FA9
MNMMNDCAGAKETAYNGPLKYWGKYRATVTNNLDPLMLGRLQAEVPAVKTTIANWALPCAPFAGPLVGFYAVPPPGANIWIEYEGGDPNHPIWTGGFWEEGEMPLEPVIPTNHVFKTEFIDMQWDDTPGEGGFSLTVSPPVAPDLLKMTFNVEGITILCPPNTISITPETMTHEVPGSVVTQTEGIMEIAVSENSITLDEAGIQGEYPNMTLSGPIEITGAVQITGDVNITGAVEIEGNVNITGAVEIEGNVNIVGAVEIEGETNVLGAVTVEGETNVLGALTVEGDVNILGGGQVEGNFAVLGLIEGVVVPPLL